MKKCKFSEAQITNILKEAQGGVPVAELCRSHGISNATFYSWRSKYGGMDASMIAELKSLQEGSVVSKRCMPSFNCKEKFFRKPCEKSGEAILPTGDGKDDQSKMLMLSVLTVQFVMICSIRIFFMILRRYKKKQQNGSGITITSALTWDSVVLPLGKN